jgi:gamma-glutamylcyclotransferase (GGCT)/AIG2-like uncharacterized protein YtfP
MTENETLIESLKALSQDYVGGLAKGQHKIKGRVLLIDVLQEMQKLKIIESGQVLIENSKTRLHKEMEFSRRMFHLFVIDQLNHDDYTKIYGDENNVFIDLHNELWGLNFNIEYSKILSLTCVEWTKKKHLRYMHNSVGYYPPKQWDTCFGESTGLKIDPKFDFAKTFSLIFDSFLKRNFQK